MSELKLTKQDVSNAKKLIESPTNWIKGSPTNYEGCYCLGGAIAKVITGSAQCMYNRELNDVFRDFSIRAGLVPSGSSRNCSCGTEGCESDYCDEVYTYNDSPNVTHGDILALLDRVLESFGE